MKLGTGFLLMLLIASAEAQGPTPETAPPLFPKGALISYGSDFISRELSKYDLSLTSRPTFSHQAHFVFTWGFYPNFDVTFDFPLITNHWNGQSELAGTGIGDSMILVKYRFYRRDSERGTTQVSVTAGPKLSTGSTGEQDSNERLLPAALQPGSGSIDLFLGLNWTYTGLFDVRRLVADEDFHLLLRSTGTQHTKLGNDFESRFWLSYRPYESKDVRREWFVGPTFTWLHSEDDQISGVNQSGSGGDVLLAGVTTFVGIAAGTHVWFGAEWNFAHSNSANFSPDRYHISIGITRQFRFF